MKEAKCKGWAVRSKSGILWAHTFAYTRRGAWNNFVSHTTNPEAFRQMAVNRGDTAVRVEVKEIRKP